VVLGLDGLTLETARALAPHCPNLARLALDHRAATVRAELPELSPVNWTSLSTAEGPERHGVYGFTRLDPRTYTLSLANADDVRTPSIFERLGAAGRTSRVINLPNTYPARPLRGMLVSGFVAEELSRAVYPPFLAHALAGYKLEADTARGAADPAYLLAELRETLASRRRALELLWADLEWDLFVFVLTETDRLFHFFHPAALDAAHPLHADVLALLREWDLLIGEVLARFDALPEPVRLMAVADHGFADLKVEVDLNAWLRGRGNLLGPLAGDQWDASVMDRRTTAYALDPGRIHLHARDTHPASPHGRMDLAPLLPALQDALLSLTWRGERVMNRVLLAEEIYGPDTPGTPGTPGGRAPGAPDLLCVPNPGFDLKAKFDRAEVFGLFGRFGTHTEHGAIWYDSGGARPERLRDVGRLILNHFGVETEHGLS
jgi:predicted AlkP superfamily phosphohydrolase/phosphomutase